MIFSCADPESFARGGLTLKRVFLFSLMNEGGSKIPLKAGHHLSASNTPYKWRFAGVPMVTQN